MPADKLTPDVQNAICGAIQAGNYLHTAAEAAGVHRATIYTWKAKGQAAAAGKYRDFYDAVKKAEAQAVARNVARIQIAAETNWTAAAWWLERKYPADWGRKESVEHTGADGAPIRIAQTIEPDPDAITAAADAIRAAALAASVANDS